MYKKQNIAKNLKINALKEREIELFRRIDINIDILLSNEGTS
jgi:hypothetical protein